MERTQIEKETMEEKTNSRNDGLEEKTRRKRSRGGREEHKR